MNFDKLREVDESIAGYILLSACFLIVMYANECNQKSKIVTQRGKNYFFE